MNSTPLTPLLTQQSLFMDSFGLWLDSKKSRPLEIVATYPFLTLIKNPSDWDLLNQCLTQLINIKASFSEGIKILELSSEIILISKNNEEKNKVLKDFETTEDFITYLKELRFPVTSQRDQLLKEKMLKLSWPFGSKVKFERRGDRGGVELKLFISNSSDLVKILASLERIKSELP